MDGFYTISLESNSCDICKQDTGEELIDYILNDRCLQAGKSGTDGVALEPYQRAHKDCLQKWKTVVQATLTAKCPSPKRSWKERIKSLLKRSAEESNMTDVWLQVDYTPKHDSTLVESSNKLNFSSKLNNNKTNPRRNSFLTNEEYRIERRKDGVSSCEERARKLRIRSVDKEDDCEASNDLLRNVSYNEDIDAFQTSWTVAELDKLCTNDIQGIITQTKRRIEEVSSLLIFELQEKDSLRQQADSLNTTVAQLVKLQQKQNIKTLSLDFEQQTQHHLVT